MPLTRRQRKNRPKRAPRPKRSELDRARDEVRRLGGVVKRRQAKLDRAEVLKHDAEKRVAKLEEQEEHAQA